ncbi:DUF4012 domain-containing protein [Nocardioidaceae bacterium]|nr:DUF4012 domain-containing protein [Nocardioidaceae bacterium]
MLHVRVLRALLLPPLVIAIVVGVVLIGRNGWQATQAVRDIRAAGTAAVALRAALQAGDVDAAGQQLAAVEAFSSAAAERLEGPTWRLTERLPGIGDDIAAVRRSSALAARAAGTLGPPLLEVARELTPDRLRPVDGAVDLQLLAEQGEALAEAGADLQRLTIELEQVELAEVVPQIQDSVRLLQFTLTEVGGLVSQVRDAAQAMGPALGAADVRRYLVLLLDPTVARPGGGEPVAYALLEADEGRLTIADSGPVEASTLAGGAGVRLEASEVAVAGVRRVDTLGDAFRTPDFRRTAQLVRTLWQQAAPGEVDGVVALDRVALSDVAAVLDDTADEPPLEPLLTADSPEQRATLAASLRSTLEQVLAGTGDSGALLDTFAAEGVVDRLHLWTADPQVERSLPRSSLAGVPTGDRDGAPLIGAYLGAPEGGPATRLGLRSIRVRTLSCAPEGRELVVSAVVAGPASEVGLGGTLGTAEVADGALLLLGSAGGDLSSRPEVDGVAVDAETTVLAGRRLIRVQVSVAAGEEVVVRTTATTRPSHQQEPLIQTAALWPQPRERVDPAPCRRAATPLP